MAISERSTRTTAVEDGDLELVEIPALSSSGPRVLLVDDEPYVVELVRRWMVQDGYECEVCTTADEAWTRLERQSFSLILADINMPGADGVQFLQRVKDRFGDEVAVLMATGVADREIAIDCLRRGAWGYLTKPLHRDDVLIQTANAIERRRLALQGRAFQCVLERRVREATAEVRQREQEIIWRLLWLADRYDIQSSAHFRRIGLYARTLAEALGWTGRSLDDIKLAAAMHDIGKIGIPPSILRKRGPLDDEERIVMQRHTLIGGEILGGSNIPLLRMAAEIALAHHERWDGTGYPRRLAGEDIPEAARIVAVVDVYDAISTDRHYRERFPEPVALAMMRAERGSHFDPRILDTFLEIQPRLIPKGQLAGHSRAV